ncbi:hypothetical protein LTR78_010456 [Recurvomyces mirabilis]|uniref:Uncharacterized protein n=1 Tax=Recurvomyces mirabilis TaxID=574656 RepID=A0AAE0WG73_9PEZI|nr:hypothetical protein LTR78_010456 [Recurvomyces mirabilis]KAK5150349.1 hypothetical protein LTS14_010188 [Recurvomyces mirabilis]
MSWLETPSTDEDLHDPWDTITMPEEADISRGRLLYRTDQPFTRPPQDNDDRMALAVQSFTKAVEIMGETLDTMRKTAVAIRKATKCLCEARSYQDLSNGHDIKYKRRSEA